jgi:hypothetical protein
MIEVNELRRQRGEEDGVRATRTRAFRVFSPTVDTALSAPGVPVEGDEHPDNPALVVLSRMTSREPELAACLVQVNYGKPQYGNGPESEPPFDAVRNLGVLSSDVAARTEAAAYPVLRPRFVSTPSLVPDGVPEERLAWQAFPARATRVLTVVTVRTAATLSLIRSVEGLFSAFREVTMQTGVLHLIGDNYYRYESRMINQATEGNGTPGSAAWNLEHSWTFDPGVPVPDPLPAGWAEQAGETVGNDNIRVPNLSAPIESEILAGKKFIVPPYSDVLYDRLELPDASLLNPTVFARLIPTIDETGYSVLPGLAGGGGGGP